MKIDESCINHNVVRIIDSMIGSPYEYADDEDFADNQRLLTLGAVRGVLDLANELKAVLKE